MRSGGGAVLVTVAAVAILGGACGVGQDSTPRDLAVSTTTSTTAPPETSGRSPAVLYFVQKNALVPVTRALPEGSDRDILTSLLQPPTDTDGASLSSSIPAGTELLGLQREGDMLRVDLSKEFQGVVGPDRQQAIAQMVLSETARVDNAAGTVQRMRFSIAGDPFKVTSPTRGDVEEVTACDFESLLANPDGDGVKLTVGQSTLLEMRRDELAAGCPRTNNG